MASPLMHAAVTAPRGSIPRRVAPASAPSKPVDPDHLSRCKHDRRSQRTQRALVEALVTLLEHDGDLSHITVASLTEQAGLTRRTFYTHFRDIPDFIEQVETMVLDQIAHRVGMIRAATLDDLYKSIDKLEPAPGSVGLLCYLRDNRALVGALMGPSGDPAFMRRLVDEVREMLAGRMQAGIFPGALGAFFDYYLTYVVSAEVGIIQRWFENGLTESPSTMARIMTVVAFVRPGDLYGMPIDINVPEYGLKLMALNTCEPDDDELPCDGGSEEDLDD